MQGIFVNGRRPKSKREIARRLTEDDGPTAVRLEATSMFGNEYDGPIAGAPDGDYTFVGPDPYCARTFYGTIRKSGDTIRVR